MPQCDTSMSTSSGPNSGTGSSCTSIAPSPTYTAARISSCTTRSASRGKFAQCLGGERERGSDPARPDLLRIAVELVAAGGDVAAHGHADEQRADRLVFHRF